MVYQPKSKLEGLGRLDQQGEEPERKRRTRRSSRVAAILEKSRQQRAARAVEKGASDATTAASRAGVEIPAGDKAELQVEAQEAQQAQATLEERVERAKNELRALIKAKQVEVDQLRTEADELSRATVSKARGEKRDTAVEAADKAQQELEKLYASAKGESQSTSIAKRQLGGMRKARREKAKWHVKRERTRKTQERVDRRIEGKAGFFTRVKDAFSEVPDRITGKIYEKYDEAWEAQDMQPVVQEQYGKKVAIAVADNHMARVEEHAALTREKIVERSEQDNSLYTRLYEPIGRASMEQLFDLDTEEYGGFRKFLARSVTVDRFAKAVLTGSIAIAAGPVAPTMAAAGILGMRTANSYLFYKRAEKSQKRGALRGIADGLMPQENTNVTKVERFSSAVGKALKPAIGAVRVGMRAARDLREFAAGEGSFADKLEAAIERLSPQEDQSFEDYISEGVGKLIEYVRQKPEQMPTEISAMSSEQLLANIGDLLAWAELSGTRLGANVFEQYKAFGVDEHRELTAGEVLDALMEEYGRRLENERSPEMIEAIAEELSSTLDAQNTAVDRILESRFVSATDRQETIKKISMGIGAGAGFVLPEAIKHGVAPVLVEAARYGAVGSLWLLSEMMGEASAETFDITDPAHFVMSEGSEYMGGTVAPGVEMHIGTGEFAALQGIGLEHVGGLTFRDETGATFDLPIITRDQGNSNSGVLPTADIAITQQVVETESGSQSKLIISLYDTSGEFQYSYGVSDDGSQLGSQLAENGIASNRQYIMSASESPRLFMAGREEDPLLGAYGDKRAEASVAHAVHELETGAGGLIESPYGFMTIRFKESDISALEQMGFNGFDESNEGAIRYIDSFGTERTLPIKQVLPESAEASPYKEASDQVVLAVHDGKVVVSVYDTHGDLQLSVSGENFAVVDTLMRTAEPYAALGVSDSDVMDSADVISLRGDQGGGEPQVRQPQPAPSMIGGSGAPQRSAPNVPIEAPVVDYVAPAPEVLEGIDGIPTDVFFMNAHKFEDDQVVAKLYQVAEASNSNFAIGDTPISVVARPVEPGVLGGERGLVLWIGEEKIRITDENLESTIDTLQELSAAANPEPQPEVAPDMPPELYEEVQGFLRAIGEPPITEPGMAFKDEIITLPDGTQVKMYGEATDRFIVTEIPDSVYSEGAMKDFHELNETYSTYLGIRDQLSEDTQMNDRIVNPETGRKVRVSKLLTDDELAFCRRFERYIRAYGDPARITAEDYKLYIAHSERGFTGTTQLNVDTDQPAGSLDLPRDVRKALDAADLTVQEARLMGDVDNFLDETRARYMTPDEMSRFMSQDSFKESYRLRQIVGFVERFGVPSGEGSSSLTLQKGDEIVRFMLVTDREAPNYGDVIVQIGPEGVVSELSDIPADLHTYTLTKFDHPSLDRDETDITYGGEGFRTRELYYDPEDPDSYNPDGTFKGTPVEESGGYDPMADRADRQADALMRRTSNNRRLGWRHFVNEDAIHGDYYGRQPLETGITQEDTTQEALAKLYAMPGRVREIEAQERLAARRVALQWNNAREIAAGMQEPIQFGESVEQDAQVRTAAIAEFRNGGTSVLKVEESGTITIDGDEEFGDPAFTYDKQDGIAVFEKRPNGRRYDVHLEGEWDKTVDQEEAERYLLKDDWQQVLREAMYVRDRDGRVLRGMPETMPPDPITGEVPPGGLDAYFTRVEQNVYYLAALYETMEAMMDAGVDREYDPELLAKTPPEYKLKNTPEFEALLREIKKTERIINKNAVLLREPADPQDAWRAATQDLPRIRY